MWRVLHKHLRFKPYRLQLLQALGPADYNSCEAFCNDFQNMLEDDSAARLVFGDECNFHLNGKVNYHNVRVWGTENPHVYTEHVHNSPMINMFCAILHNMVYGPYIFAENTVNEISY